MEISDDYMERLRAVFDLCDIAQQGYISVTHFQELAKEHFGAEGEEDLGGIINVLDATGDGKIYFNEFCEGVKQILELKSPGTPPVWPGSQQPKLYAMAGSEETLVAQDDEDEDAVSNGTQETSEMSTYNEYDMMTDDDAVMTNSITSSNGGGHQMSVSPPLIPRTQVLASEDEGYRGSDDQQTNKSECEAAVSEEKFEDYGEASSADNGKPPSEVNGTHTPDRPHTLQLPSSSRRFTSSALASHLYRGGSSTGHSRQSSCSSTDFYDDIDGSFTELSDKVHALESQLSMLSEKQHKSDEKALRLKEENTYLVERVHLLEEQLRELEMRSMERMEEERRKHREILTKTDKEKSQEIELLSLSLKTIDKEYKSLKDEVPRLRSENDRLRKENAQLEERLRHSQRRLTEVADDADDTRQRLLAEKADSERERRAGAELLDELSRELEELRVYKQQQELRGAGMAGGEDAAGAGGGSMPRSHRKQMEAHITALRQENQALRTQNEELHASLLSTSVREGRSLLEGGTTVAQEIQDLPKEELIQALRESQQENKRLREHVDAITLRIIENNPTILEIDEPKEEKKEGRFSFFKRINTLSLPFS